MAATPFNAFISYSRRDQAIAGRLEKQLERYRVPRKFRHDRKRLTIFRDVEDVGVGDLSEVLAAALDSSDFLIVLCSPASRESTYVNQEIRHFGGQRGSAKIIPVLVDGRPDGEVGEDDPVQDRAFPPALYEFFEEPLAADLRIHPGRTRRERAAQRREAKFQIIAKLLYTDKSEELVGRERARRRLIASAAILLVLSGLGYGGWRFYDRIPKPGISLAGIPADEAWGKRTRERIANLRTARREMVPERTDRGRLLVATWSMRDFASNRFGMGLRSDEAVAYLAEILSWFDLVALQELDGDGPAFEGEMARLLDHLGSHWSLVVSGVAEGRSGDGERLGFLFDTRKLRFGDFTDEVVLPSELLERHELTEQIARTPFMAGFWYGEVRLLACNVHIWYGANSGPRAERRIKEREALADYLVRVMEGKRGWGDHLVLLGDLQTVHPGDEGLSLLRTHGFAFPAGVEELMTNARMDKCYDQIATRFPTSGTLLHAVESGVFDYFAHVYREEDEALYEGEMKDRRESAGGGGTTFSRFANWRTFQMSDHLPKWVLFSTSREDAGGRD